MKYAPGEKVVAHIQEPNGFVLKTSATILYPDKFERRYFARLDMSELQLQDIDRWICEFEILPFGN